MSDHAEPTDEALAVFSVSHPGRERDALNAALAFYERTKGEPCTNPAAYFGRWPVSDLQKRLKLGLATGPKCPRCNGDVWLLDQDTEQMIRCDHAAAAGAA